MGSPFGVSRAAEKLRQQQCEAGAVSVLIQTNPFKPAVPQFQRTVTEPVSPPTSDTRHLIAAATTILGGIYRSGYAYHKAGVMLSNLTPLPHKQAELFAVQAADHRSRELMTTMDAINGRWGRGTLRSSATAIDHGWRMRRERLSPAYTTSWDELPVVRAV